MLRSVGGEKVTSAACSPADRRCVAVPEVCDRLIDAMSEAAVKGAGADHVKMGGAGDDLRRIGGARILPPVDQIAPACP